MKLQYLSQAQLSNTHLKPSKGIGVLNNDPKLVHHLMCQILHKGLVFVFERMQHLLLEQFEFPRKYLW